MPDKTNPLQGVIDGLVGEYRDSKKAAKTQGVVPIGSKQVSVVRAAKEFAAMSPEQRQATMDKIGVEETMKLVKHLGGESD